MAPAGGLAAALADAPVGVLVKVSAPVVIEAKVSDLAAVLVRVSAPVGIVAKETEAKPVVK